VQLEKFKKTKELDFFTSDFLPELELSFFEGFTEAFPSTYADYTEANLDLNKELVKNSGATIYVRVKGLSLIDTGINNNDVNVIYRYLEPKDGQTAVCFIDDDFTPKRSKRKKNGIYLVAATKDFQIDNYTGSTINASEIQIKVLYPELEISSLF